MEIEKAFKKLLIQNPFYGIFCMGLPKEVTKEVPTLAVVKDGISCKLCINPDFWKTLVDTEQIAVLTHELSHIALKHMFMCEDFTNKEIFNYAADAEVNSYIEGLPKGAITASYLSKVLGRIIIEGLGTKKYYELLCNEQDKLPNHSSLSQNAEGGSSENQPQQQKGEEKIKGIGSHDGWKDFKNSSDAEKQLINANIDSIIRETAEQIEKMQGEIPGNLGNIVEKLRKPNKPVFNWKAYFRRMLGTIYDINIKSSRKMPSKRFPDSAGIKHKKKVSILVAIDTSGSINKKELQDFFSEIDYVHKAGARVTLIQCDTRITSISEYDGKIPEICGRGGTSFDPPIEYYVKNKKEYSSLIYFTDGYSSTPIKRPSNVIWVVSSSGVTDNLFGKIVQIPKNNEQN